jgi:fatty acid hydroxylase domain-containing protein 2
MAYLYTRARPTQHLLLGTVLATALAIGSTEAFAASWAGLVDGVSDRWMLTGGLMLVHTVVFWSVGGAFHYVDTHDRPVFIARHRIQRDKRKHPEIGPTVRNLMRNQFVFLPVLLLGFGELLLLRGWTVEAELPSLLRLSLELAGQAVLAPAVFYLTHRFLHRKWWMKRVHRVHHEFRTTTAFASEYAHPVEFATGNFLTLVFGAFVIAPHILSMYLFSLLALLTVLVHHSGYALPWAPWGLPHDWHHYRFNEIYGTTGFWDRMLGTDADFRQLKDGDER